MKTRNLLFSVMLVLFFTVAFTGSASAGRPHPFPTIMSIAWQDTTTDAGSHIFTTSNVTLVGAPSGSYLVLTACKLVVTGGCTGEWWEISNRVAVKGSKPFSLTSKALTFTGTGNAVVIYLRLHDKNDIELARSSGGGIYAVGPDWAP